MIATSIHTRALGMQPYVATFAAMQRFTKERDAATADECWLVQHPPVYTLGRNAKHRARIDDAAVAIPQIQTDRGGDITYHGPGQAVVYVLLDLSRRGHGVKTLVHALEQAAIDLLSAHGISAARRRGAPGVYVDGAKVAALGLRVTRGCSYHGLALNVDMDLRPFAAIAPCGFSDLRVTQLRALGIALDTDVVAAQLAQRLQHILGYNAGSSEGQGL